MLMHKCFCGPLVRFALYLAIIGERPKGSIMPDQLLVIVASVALTVLLEIVATWGKSLVNPRAYEKRRDADIFGHYWILVSITLVPNICLEFERLLVPAIKPADMATVFLLFVAILFSEWLLCITAIKQLLHHKKDRMPPSLVELTTHRVNRMGLVTLGFCLSLLLLGAVT
jgi:hypothetical protein